MVSIAPLSFKKLRAVDDDFAQLDALASLDHPSDDIDASAQAEDKAGVLAVED